MVPVAKHNRTEVVTQIERMANQRVHMSARDLIRAHREGRLPDPGQVGDILVLADMLPEDDPLFAR
jgi:hypothetical protein